MKIYGEMGVLADDGEKVQCHICGRWFLALPRHLTSSHKVSAKDYRDQFGLNRTQPLISQGLSERLAVIQTERLSNYWGACDLTALNNSKKDSKFKMRAQGVTKVKQSNSTSNKIEAQRAKMKGRLFTEVHKAKISMSLKGIVRSKESKAKQSETRKTLLLKLFSDPDQKAFFVKKMNEARIKAASDNSVARLEHQSELRRDQNAEQQACEVQVLKRFRGLNTE